MCISNRELSTSVICELEQLPLHVDFSSLYLLHTTLSATARLTLPLTLPIFSHSDLLYTHTMSKSSLARIATSASRPAICRRAPRVAFASLPTTASPSSTARSYHISSASRPRLSTLTQTQAQPWWSLAGKDAVAGRRSIFIQTENTPNTDALKFLPNHPVLPEGVSVPYIEYLNPRATIAPPYPSPLAAQLMNVDGVTAVFYGSDFITVTKAPDANWAHIRPEVFSLITETITSGQQIVKSEPASASASSDSASGPPAEVDSLQYDENDSEVVGMIKELLETRIRPAIQEDGGDIEFRGFEGGHVYLKLRGACRTCDSSTVTLKSGIEGMLMHYIEEVQGVTQVLDQEEEIALSEFAKFEEKLKHQKGAEATA
ncbi:hira-interacting protein 5 [Ophiostoma piceae UAMH 11346]|uniref:Hira-interacting protein 5 n=1 Tax=Ophiostoma piceae (strain UAMH 11346) TaxID=1262450 RepID=S3C0H4_OPHP1|nr:hira-interacting protein 5 [Ophiostoma piceae UAMH 11346]